MTLFPSVIFIHVNVKKYAAFQYTRIYEESLGKTKKEKNLCCSSQEKLKTACRVADLQNFALWKKRKSGYNNY